MDRPPLLSESFTVTHDGIANVLRSDTLIYPAFDPKTVSKTPDPCPCVGIWDTGATTTCISQNIVDKCSLKPVGMAVTHTASGVLKTSVYLVNIMLRNNVGIPYVRVVQADIHGADILIGMDIIGRGDFAITCSDRKTVFSFRLPSIALIDFVAEKNQAKEPIRHDKAIPSRNSPCSCGSGKKYKKCCGK